MKCITIRQTCVTRRVVVSRAANGEQSPVKKGAALLLGMGAALAVAQSGPAGAASFSDKVEAQKRAVAEQSSRLEYLLEQQMNAAKAGAKGKEEVRPLPSPCRAPLSSGRILRLLL